MNRILRVVCCLFFLLTICVPVMSSDHPDDVHWQSGPSLPGIDGRVYALTVYDGHLIAGGEFTVACNTIVSNIAAWDGSSWTPLGDGTNDRINTLTVYDGRLIAAGEFTEAGGTSVGHIAAWNGVAWTTLGTGTDGIVRALTVHDGELVAGGTFGNAGGVPAPYIASWNGTAWDSLGAGVDNGVLALTVYDGQLIAAGYFLAAGGISAGRIAAWNGSAWDTLGTGVDGAIYALTVYAGVLVAGGDFSDAGDFSVGNIATWDGAEWLPLGSGFDDDVRALSACAGTLYAGGDFDTADGSPAKSIAVWDGAGWDPLGSGFQDFLPYVYAIACFENDMVAAGFFDDVGGEATMNIAAWNGSAWSALGSGWTGGIDCFAVYDGKLIAAGIFLEIEGVAANRIAAWDGAAWSPLGTGMNARVQALTVCDGQLIAGGSFTVAGGVPVTCIAAWNGSVWSSMGSISIQTHDDRPVELLGCYNGSPVAVSWYYDSYADMSWRFIFRWNGSDWVCIGDGIEPDDPHGSLLGIRAFTEYDGKLITVGSFSSITNVSARGLAAWDGSVWSALGSGGGAMWTMDCIVHDGKLYSGGGFDHLRSWDGSTWSSLMPGGDGFDIFCAFASLGDSLVIGGGFPIYHELLGNNIVVWDGVAGLPLGSGLNGSVSALEVYGNTIFAAGSFTIAGGKPSAYLARWSREDDVAVCISGLWTNPVGTGIELCWSIAADEQIEGFRLYRSRVGEEEEYLLNEQLIDPDIRSYIDDSVLPGKQYFYSLAALVADGREVRSYTVEAECPQTRAQLFQNSPNPFNPSTSIRFAIPASLHVKLRVYDISGRLVRILIDRRMAVGGGEALWDGKNDAGSSAASGVYFYRLQVGKTTLSKKMLLLR